MKNMKNTKWIAAALMLILAIVSATMLFGGGQEAAIQQGLLAEFPELLLFREPQFPDPQV